MTEPLDKAEPFDERNAHAGQSATEAEPVDEAEPIYEAEPNDAHPGQSATEPIDKAEPIGERNAHAGQSATEAEPIGEAEPVDEAEPIGERNAQAGPSATDALAADALRLLGSAQEWARQTFEDADLDAHATGHSGPDCQWCPLCQFVAVLRGERPELTERVAETGAALMTVLRAALDAAANATPQGQHRADTAPPTPRVQRIDLGGGE